MQPKPLLQLENIQSRLLDVGSAVATPVDRASDSKLKRVDFDETSTSALEVIISWYMVLSLMQHWSQLGSIHVLWVFYPYLPGAGIVMHSAYVQHAYEVNLHTHATFMAPGDLCSMEE